MKATTMQQLLMITATLTEKDSFKRGVIPADKLIEFITEGIKIEKEQIKTAFSEGTKCPNITAEEYYNDNFTVTF